MRNHRRRLITGLLTISALGAGLLVPAATFAASPAPSAEAAAVCPDTHWPASVQGRPVRLHAGARGGDYIWHDAKGWHLRVTHHGTKKVVFTGKIVSSAPMTVTPYRLENADGITLSADKLTLTYRFRNYGRLDGLDFKTDCAQRLAISGSMAGKKLPDQPDLARPQRPAPPRESLRDRQDQVTLVIPGVYGRRSATTAARSLCPAARGVRIPGVLGVPSRR